MADGSALLAVVETFVNVARDYPRALRGYLVTGTVVSKPPRGRRLSVLPPRGVIELKRNRSRPASDNLIETSDQWAQTVDDQHERRRSLLRPDPATFPK